MVHRCTNPRNVQWKDYGGRGITVHADWVGPGGFLRWYNFIGPRPSPKHTIDRIDNEKGYEPGNVRWATREKQMSNFRRNNLVTLADETLPLTAWARRIGVSAPTLAYRLRAGWDEQRILSTGGRA